MPGADERNDARLGALHEEVVHLRDRLQEQAEEVAVMRSEINGLAPAATAVLVRFIR